MNGAAPLVRVRDLAVHFPIRRGLLRRQVGAIRAVDGVDLDIRAGETLGLVGESGSGKSTTGRALLRLQPATSGTVEFDGVDLASLAPPALRRLRRDMQIVFQDPMASLNPRRTVGDTVREPLDIHALGTPAERRARTQVLLERVGLDPAFASRYPHEFSGGQRQRVGIARALATGPRFVVADEPISALDVSIQAQIVNLLADLKEDLGLTYLFIAHDLAMVRHLSDRVAILYLGRVAEIGPTRAVFDAPRHPYTRALLSSIPIPDPSRRARSAPLVPGELPDPAHPPAGCRFHPRCPLATDLCRRQAPVLTPTSPQGEGHQAACHHSE
ncbi:MAG: ATP-binding cassette domain-containing protein [Gemmatimonadota bacterium]